MRKLFLSTAATTCIVAPAFAADLAVKAPAIAPAYLEEWSGIYVGLEGGYGWGRHTFDAFNRIPGFGGVDDTGTVNFPQFVGANVGSIKQSGWLAGGFLGAQKQFGNWVLGIEADIDATGIKGSAGATGSSLETLTGPGPLFVTTQPFTTSPVNLTIPGQTISSTGSTAPFTLTLPGQTVTGNGQTITLPNQTVTVPGQTVNSTGSFTIPGQTLTVNGQDITIPSQTVTVAGQTVPVTAGSFTIPGQPLTVNGQNIAIPGQTIAVGPQGITLTDTVTGLTPGTVIPAGTKVPVIVTSGDLTTAATLKSTNDVTVDATGKATFTATAGGTVTSGDQKISLTTLIQTTGTTISTTDQTIHVNGQDLTIPGSTVTINGQTATLKSVDVIIPSQTIHVNGQDLTIPGQTVTVAVSGQTQDQKITVPGQTVNVNGQTIKLPDQTITIPSQTISSTGQTQPVTVTIPRQTIPGQKNPVLNANGTPVIVPNAVTFAGINVTRSTQVDTKIDELGSLRGKIGFVAAPNWLIYGTGGLAWAHATNTVTATETFSIGNTLFSRASSMSGGATLLGWAVGAGIDWKMAPNWILGAEYLHYEFPKNTIGLSDGSVSANFSNSRQSVDAVKGRISYLFPIH
jgi:opacity protein-like surface antigen